MGTSIPSAASSAVSSISKSTNDLREFQILGTSGTDSQELIPIPMDRQMVEFYTRDIDIFSKLPLAAGVYVAFEFFFMNQKRQLDFEQGIYYENEEELEEVQLTEFWSVVGLRIFAAFAITFLTILVTQNSF